MWYKKDDTCSCRCTVSIGYGVMIMYQKEFGSSVMSKIGTVCDTSPTGCA